MVGKGIEQFYNCYKRNLYEIRHIEKSIFEESYNYHKWEAGLQEKSQILRDIYEQNEKLLNDEIRLLYENAKEINEDLVTDLLQHIMYFIYEDHMDFEITEKVLQLLEDYIETKAADWQKIKYYYIKGLMTAKGMLNEADYDWFDKIIAVCEDWTKSDRNGSKERILDAHIYRIICAVKFDKTDVKGFFKFVDEAKRQWERPETLDVLQQIHGKERDVEHYIEQRLELIDYLQVLILSKENFGKMTENEISRLYTYFEQEYKKGVENRKLNARIFLAYHQMRYYMGRIDEAEYVKSLDLYMRPAPYEYPGHLNFEMRKEDLVTSLEQHRYLCNSFSYALILLPEKLMYSQSDEKREQIYKEIEQYICGLSTLENAGYLDLKLVETMIIMASRMEEQKVFRLLETIMLHRQLPTAIHLAMVSKLVEIFIKHIVDEKPEMLVGLLNTTSVEDVRNAREEIIAFVVKAGLCHDIGKLACTDIINLQSRRITNEEFGLIKGHPTTGKQIADKIPAFRPYSNIILGHHMFADRTGGYPMNVDIPVNAYTLVIDLITICDSIDAATDILGRNYAKGKSFERIVTELINQSGTRYSKELVDILCESKSLSEQLENLTGTMRANVYHDLYVRKVKPLALDKEYVERCFTEYKDSDRKFVADFLEQYYDAIPSLTIDEFEQCDEKYLVENSRREIIGFFLGNRSCLNQEKGILLQILFIKDTARKVGIGQRILQYAETELQQKGYSFIAMESKEELSNRERFMWINGYTRNKDNLLVKYLSK